jgi:hypothetical protein
VLCKEYLSDIPPAPNIPSDFFLLLELSNQLNYKYNNNQSILAIILKQPFTTSTEIFFLSSLGGNNCSDFQYSFWLTVHHFISYESLSPSVFFPHKTIMDCQFYHQDNNSDDISSFAIENTSIVIIDSILNLFQTILQDLFSIITLLK